MLRLQGAGVREIFVIAGDARRQAGEFADAAGLLAAMADFRERLDQIGSSVPRARTRRTQVAMTSASKQIWLTMYVAIGSLSNIA